MVLQLIKSSFAKVKSALTKARTYLGDQIHTLLHGGINAQTLDKLEQLFYEADFGARTAADLADKMRHLHRLNPSWNTNDYLKAIRAELLEILTTSAEASVINKSAVAAPNVPTIIMMVGVNGNGKTTSVAKLANLLQMSGKKVLLAAADTFRAAACEQLEIWAQKINVDIVRGNLKSDPAAVAFDAICAAKARQIDYVLIDTAGRLHTKIPLMQELEKIKRSSQKAAGHMPDETFLVLDATTGQNAIEQARQFHKFTPLSGIILTKLDGTAKGGIAIAIQKELKIPIKFIGTGEGLQDLEAFDAQTFVNNLL